MAIEAVTLLIDSNRGIYIPKTFAMDYRMECKGDTTAGAYKNITMEDVEELKKGPESEHYWDTWADVVDNAYFEHEGNKYTLYQDGDLFLLCTERMTKEERDNFGFDED